MTYCEREALGQRKRDVITFGLTRSKSFAVGGRSKRLRDLRVDCFAQDQKDEADREGSYIVGHQGQKWITQNPSQ